MPRCNLNDPPPPRPAVDKDVSNLQFIVIAMNIEQRRRQTGDQTTSLVSEEMSRTFAVRRAMFGILWINTKLMKSSL